MSMTAVHSSWSEEKSIPDKVDNYSEATWESQSSEGMTTEVLSFCHEH